MAKEFYDVTVKTYFNTRLKEVMYKGMETYPLYVQVTYDRKSIVFKSYYFDVFAQPKYDFLTITFAQINELEGRVIDSIVKRNANDFSLDLLLRRYRLYCLDILDNFDGPFKIWLGAYLKKEGLPALAVLFEHAPEEICAIRIWDDLRKIVDPGFFEKMEEKAAQAGPYLPLAEYVRHSSPEGPFCLPFYEWIIFEKSIEIEEFIDEKFWQVDFGLMIRTVSRLLSKKATEE